jgi:hypothetical protein
MRGVLLLSCAGAVAVGAAASAGCNGPVYLTEYRSLQTSAADGGMGFASDTDTFTIPIRPPTADERRQLDQEQMQKGLPMPVPWVGVRDLPIEVEYTLKNLDAQAGKAFFTLLGGDEFGAYNPGAYFNPLDPNAVAPPPLAGSSPVDLAPNATAQLTFREDDLAEAGIDLEAIVRYPGPSDPTIPFKVLNSRSSASNIGLTAIPPNDVTPAMIGLTFTLTADVHVQADYVVRVRNLTGRLAPAGSNNLYP